MPEIALLKHRFWQYDPKLLTESFFEKRLLERKLEIFPNHFVFKMKCTIKSFPKDTRPDLVLIAKDLSHWIVVEVETVHDPISTVRDQIARISRGVYDDRVFNYIVGLFSSDDIDKAKLLHLLRSKEREFLLISNEFTDGMKNLADEFSFDFLAVEVYDAIGHDYAFRIIGEVPKTLHEYEVEGQVDDSVPDFVELSHHDRINEMQIDTTVHVVRRGLISPWNVKRRNESTCLMATEKSPFICGKKLVFIKYGRYLIVKE